MFIASAENEKAANVFVCMYVESTYFKTAWKAVPVHSCNFIYIDFLLFASKLVILHKTMILNVG